jgi:hypothetical protein
MVEALAARYERDPNVVSREIGGEQILVPIRKRTVDMAALYVLNETGARIWNLLDGQRSLADVRDLLIQEYNVEPEAAEGDLLEIVGQLREIGVLKPIAHAV